MYDALRAAGPSPLYSGTFAEVPQLMVHSLDAIEQKTPQIIILFLLFQTWILEWGLRERVYKHN